MSAFRTTRWSMIAAAAKATAEGRTALAELCQIYWSPVYLYVRRRGHGPQEAQDLVQGFFAEILEGDDLAGLDPARGRFRSWLLKALSRSLSNAARHDRAKRRHPGAALVSIDALAEDERHDAEPADLLTPERLYQRRWAIALLEACMAQLEQWYARRGQRAELQQLRPFLVGEEPTYAELAAQLGKSPETLRVQVHRLRRRYRDIVRDQIADTVAHPADVDDELRSLLAAL